MCGHVRGSYAGWFAMAKTGRQCPHSEVGNMLGRRLGLLHGKSIKVYRDVTRARCCICVCPCTWKYACSCAPGLGVCESLLTLIVRRGEGRRAFCFGHCFVFGLLNPANVVRTLKVDVLLTFRSKCCDKNKGETCSLRNLSLNFRCRIFLFFKSWYQ